MRGSRRDTKEDADPVSQRPFALAVVVVVVVDVVVVVVVAIAVLLLLSTRCLDLSPLLTHSI